MADNREDWKNNDEGEGEQELDETVSVACYHILEIHMD